MSKGKINYEEFLKQHFWSLEEAVSLLTGEPSNINNQFTGGLLTHKEAIKAIENGALESEVKEIMYKHIESKEYKPTPTHCVKPRDFIKWSTANTIEFSHIEWRHNKQNNVVPELLQYFNYQYWINRKYWNFDETIMILLSTESPFPHEIVNVFEIDERHQKFSNLIMQLIINEKFEILDSKYNKVELFSSQNHNIRNCFFKQKDFLVELKNEIDFVKANPTLHIVLSNDLLINSKIIDDYATRLITENNKLVNRIRMLLSEDGESFYNNKVYGNHFSLPLVDDIISLSSALDLISGIERYYINKEEEENFKSYFIDWLNRRYANRSRYQSFFERDYNNNQINFLTDKKYEDDALSGILRFGDLINWAMGRNILIPTELKSNNGVEKSAKSVDDIGLWKKFIRDKLEGEFRADIDYVEQASNAYHILTETQKEKLSYFDVKKRCYKKTVITNDLLDLAKQYKINIARSSINEYITLPFVEKTALLKNE